MRKNHLRIQLKPWTSEGFNRAVFIFPGQGSFDQKKTEEFTHQSQVFRDYLQTAELLSKTFSFPSPLEALEAENPDPVAQNLLLFCLQVALFEEARLRLVEPEFLITHSFGEYAALCSTGALSFSEVYQIVAHREIASPKPQVQGGLIAVSASPEKVSESRFSRPVFLANRNSPRQTVIAVAQGDIKLILRELRDQLLPAKELKTVGRPYHSPLMTDARERFALKLNDLNLEIKPLRIPFVSSVTGQLYPAGTLFRKDEMLKHLSDQLTNQVDFIKQVQCLPPDKFDAILELNFSETTLVFAKEILLLPNLCFLSCSAFLPQKKNDEDNLTTRFKISDTKAFEIVSKFISQITGYRIEEIRLEQKLEEDLRIDSIKKAEVLFRTFQEKSLEVGTNLEVARLKRVGDIVHLIENLEAQGVSGSKEAALFSVRKGGWQEVPPPLWTQPAVATERILQQSRFHTLSSFGQNQWLLRLTSEPELEDLPDFLTEVQSSLAGHLRAPSIQQSVILLGRTSPAFHGLRAFLKCLSFETFPFQIKIIQTDSPLSDQTLTSEFNELSSREVRYVLGQRQLWTLQTPAEPQASQPVPRHLFSIGGSSGILKAFFQSASLTETNLTIVGRRSQDDDSVRDVLEKSKDRFRSVRYLQADALSRDALLGVFGQAEQWHGPVDLAIDASGTQSSLFFEKKTKNEIASELQSKILPLMTLLQLRSQKEVPFQILKLNSVAASHGNPGQSVYAFANDYSSAFEGVSPIYLPATDGIGMTESESVKRAVKMLGLDLLPEDQIARLFQQAVLDVRDPLFVMSPKNEFLLAANLLPSRWDHTQLGKASGSDLTFERSLDVTELPFLRGHLMLSQCLVPASLYMAQLYNTLKGVTQSSPSVLSYELKNLITLEAGPVNVKTRFRWQSPKEVSGTVSSHIENFSILCQSISPLKPSRSIAAPLLIRSLDMRDFYSPKFLELSGVFANLEWAKVADSGEVIGCLKPGSCPVEMLPETYRLMNLFEAAFQMMGAAVMWFHHLTVVPAKVISASFQSVDDNEIVFLRISDLHPISASRWGAKAQALNRSGQVVFEMEKLEGEVVVKHESCPTRFQEIHERPW